MRRFADSFATSTFRNRVAADYKFARDALEKCHECSGAATELSLDEELLEAAAAEFRRLLDALGQ
jgi:hypothetical protein